VKKRFLFGKVWIENGQLVCRPASKVGSHMLTSSLDANCILSAGQGETILNKGDEITVNILPWKTLH
jgi:molybdopterin biosynthesis enzyme